MSFLISFSVYSVDTLTFDAKGGNDCIILGICSLILVWLKWFWLYSDTWDARARSRRRRRVLFWSGRVWDRVALRAPTALLPCSFSAFSWSWFHGWMNV